MNKDKRIKEVLAVLDLSEEEQCKWLSEYFRAKYYQTDKWSEWYGVCDVLENNTFPSRKIVLAYLAFGMRDEFQGVIEKVHFELGRFHVFAESNEKSYNWIEEHCDLVDSWFVEWSQPIHWIVAAIIAGILAESEGQNEH